MERDKMRRRRPIHERGFIAQWFYERSLIFGAPPRSDVNRSPALSDYDGPAPTAAANAIILAELSRNGMEAALAKAQEFIDQEKQNTDD